MSDFGSGPGTRTPMSFRTVGPKPTASANSASPPLPNEPSSHLLQKLYNLAISSHQLPCYHRASMEPKSSATLPVKHEDVTGACLADVHAPQRPAGAVESFTKSCTASHAVPVGQKFNMWTVLGPAEPTSSGIRQFLCQCECGIIKPVVGSNVTRGRSACCGCTKAEVSRRNFTTHGQSEAPEYGIWKGMRERCRNVNHAAYDRYGGAGVRVCDRWNNFGVFLSDMGPRPSLRHSVDRYPNARGNYEPGNCRWATPSEQSRNQPSRKTLTYCGQTMIPVDWAKIIGISVGTLFARLKRGWSVERCIEIPLRKPTDPRRPNLVAPSDHAELPARGAA